MKTAVFVLLMLMVPSLCWAQTYPLTLTQGGTAAAPAPMAFVSMQPKDTSKAPFGLDVNAFNFGGGDVDEVLHVGYNPFGEMTAEPSAVMAIEQDYFSGSDKIEFYWQLFTGSAATVGAGVGGRPFGVVFDRPTGFLYPSVAYGSSSAGSEGFATVGDVNADSYVELSGNSLVPEGSGGGFSVLAENAGQSLVLYGHDSTTLLSSGETFIKGTSIEFEKVDGTPIASVSASGYTGTVVYSPATPSNWASSAPTTEAQALDRIAAALAALGHAP